MSGLPSHRLKQAKRALRRQVLAARDALPGQDRRVRSEAVAARFLTLPEFREARTILVFWSFGSELDTGPLVDGSIGSGRTIAMPRIEGADIVPVVFRPGDEVRSTSFGAFEPVGGQVLEPSDLDLVVVPGVAFDATGRRVGYGGGFYDRLLPRLRPGIAAIAAAFSIQVVPSVPAGGTDRPVDAIVTEAEVIRCR